MGGAVPQNWAPVPMSGFRRLRSLRCDDRSNRRQFMIATPQAITEAKGKRRPRLRLMLNSVAERRLGARGMASLGRKLAAAGFGLVHACGGCGIEIARG